MASRRDARRAAGTTLRRDSDARAVPGPSAARAIPVEVRPTPGSSAIARRGHAALGTIQRRVKPDLLGVLTLLLLTGVGVWRDFVRGGTLVRLDVATYFLPLYGFLGETLRHGHLPVWNPYQFSGVPFAADPESGWTYLPAMLLYTILPPATATKALVVFHLLLAGLSTYALARLLGMRVIGALVAAVAYEFSALFDRAHCCPTLAEVSAWVPLTLIGVELAVRGDDLVRRAAWWGIAGFGLSQIFAAWLGQGAYYAVLTVGGYLTYRTLLAPPRPRPLARRAVDLALHGGALLLFGVGLAAAGILPRLEYNALSSLAGGRYQGNLAWAAKVGGWTKTDMAEHLLGTLPHRGWYTGGAVVALALIAPVVLRRRFAAPYFALLSVVTIVLTARHQTPLHVALYHLLPRFQTLHQHFPERITIVFYLGPALLAGGVISALAEPVRRPRSLALLAMVPILGLLALTAADVALAPQMRLALAVASLGGVAVASWPGPTTQRLVPLLLLATVVVDMLTPGLAAVESRRYGDRTFGATVDLDSYGASSGAAAFLQSRREDQPFRYLGLYLAPPGRGYRDGFADPEAVALLINNRGTILHLQDAQGQNNPIQLRRYVEYMTALNGQPQEYHDLDVLPAGFNSPLLDLLDVRYIVLPATIPAGRADLSRLVTQHPVVYRDDRVQVIENRDALPRVWIVHAARRTRRGEALSLLASRAVDPRRTALLEEPGPPLIQPDAAAPDYARITMERPDEIGVRTSTIAPGLLMLGEVYYPAWQAYVDGKPVHLYVADHALRAVPIPAGKHTVELRYESRSLRLGLAISLVASAALAVVLLAAGWRWHRARRRPRSAPTSLG